MAERNHPSEDDQRRSRRPSNPLRVEPPQDRVPAAPRYVNLEDDRPKVDQHLGSVPFVIGREGHQVGWYSSYPFPPLRIRGTTQPTCPAFPYRSPNSKRMCRLPCAVGTPPRPFRAITRRKPSIRENNPVPIAQGASSVNSPPHGAPPIRRVAPPSPPMDVLVLVVSGGVLFCALPLLLPVGEGGKRRVFAASLALPPPSDTPPPSQRKRFLSF